MGKKGFLISFDVCYGRRHVCPLSALSGGPKKPMIYYLQFSYIINI